MVLAGRPTTLSTTLPLPVLLACWLKVRPGCLVSSCIKRKKKVAHHMRPWQICLNSFLVSVACTILYCTCSPLIPFWSQVPRPSSLHYNLQPPSSAHVARCGLGCILHDRYLIFPTWKFHSSTQRRCRNSALKRAPLPHLHHEE